MFARAPHPPAAPRPDGPIALEDLERVYRAHVHALLAVARRLVGAIDAEVVVQEVFLELLRNADLRGRFTEGAHAAWLGEITRRKALEHLRRAGREIPSEDLDAEARAAPEPGLAARDLLARFVARRVPEAQRRFFVARFIEERTQVEAAALLGIARSTLEGWEHKLARDLRRFVLSEEESR
jgi:RNA polymerase sigma factor (sigma-70 family)